jgi:hypothetical protein
MNFGIFLILFVSFVCQISSGQDVTDDRTRRNTVNDHLRTVIEQERQNFPCGW